MLQLVYKHLLIRFWGKRGQFNQEGALSGAAIGGMRERGRGISFPHAENVPRSSGDAPTRYSLIPSLIFNHEGRADEPGDGTKRW